MEENGKGKREGKMNVKRKSTEIPLY